MEENESECLFALVIDDLEMTMHVMKWRRESV